MSNCGNEEGWECSICLSSDFDPIGFKCRQQISKCGHRFHLDCITQHFSIKNKIWKKDVKECVLECPLCRSQSIKNNYGVLVKYDPRANEMILYKGIKFLHFPVITYGKDIFKRDVKKAKQLLQNVADLCFDVECYWIITKYLSGRILNRQYADDEKSCAKLIQLPNNQYENEQLISEKIGSKKTIFRTEKEVYIERSFGI